MTREPSLLVRKADVDAHLPGPSSATLQRPTVPSPPPEASQRPSGENATDHTPSPWCLRRGDPQRAFASTFHRPMAPNLRPTRAACRPARKKLAAAGECERARVFLQRAIPFTRTLSALVRPPAAWSEGPETSVAGGSPGD